MKIRPVEHERDAAAIVELIRETRPLQLVDRDAWLHRARALPARMRQLHVVAELGGTVVGDAWSGYTLFSGGQTAAVHVRVLREHRRRGIGAALFEAIRRHALDLGVDEVVTMFDENDDGVRFARERGFGEVRGELWSVLDTGAVTARPDPAVEVVAARDLDPRDLHRVDDEATRDMPMHGPYESFPYEEWLDFVWRDPFFTKDGSFGAIVNGELAAVSLLGADRTTGRGVNMFTGTLVRYRGRGLARAVKLASTNWATGNGIQQLATTNDERNAPMLAINRRLGYRPAIRLVEYSGKRERLLRQGGEHL